MKDTDEPTLLSYEQFLLERQRLIDARQRQLQRVDQLVVGGAAGALALSITFLEKIAPSPSPATRPVLLLAWGLLLAALGLTLRSHFVSIDAFEWAISDFDDCYRREVPAPSGRNPVTPRAVRLARAGAAAFVVGVLALAAFAFLNVRFDATPGHRLNALTPTFDGRPEARSAVPAASSGTASPAASLPRMGQAHGDPVDAPAATAPPNAEVRAPGERSPAPARPERSPEL